MEKNYEIEETFHPMCGEPLWKVKDISLPLGGITDLVQKFIDEYPHEDYTLSIFDNHTGNTFEIECATNEMPKIVEYVYHLEKGTPLTFVGYSTLSESYVVGMSISKGRMEFGVYKAEDGTLKFISPFPSE